MKRIRPTWLSPSQAIDHPNNSTFHLAKEIVIELDMWDVCTGVALESLPRTTYKDGLFPHVRVIKLIFDCFCESGDMSALPPDAQTNAVSFVRRIRQMAPSASKIEMETDVMFGASSDELQMRLSSLLAQLFRLATRVKHFSYERGITHDRQMELVCNLVHLNCDIRGDGISYMRLARQCALTLQSLAMGCTQNGSIIDLIQDSNNDYVEYPQLLSLKHSVWKRSTPLELPIFSGTIPFPCLKRLLFKTDYPFGDNTPFRGNAGSLELLSLTLDHLTLSTLQRFKVFTPTSHPMLQCVDITLSDNVEPAHLTTMTDLARFSLSIGPGAPVRKIDDFENDEIAWPQILPLLGTYNSIQVLVLAKLPPTLWDTITLIRSLPLLSELHTQMLKLGEMPVDVNLAQLPAYVILHYPAMGKRFRFWNIVEYTREISNETVHCVLLLALICPNFDYATLQNYNYHWFTVKMKAIMLTDVYKQYATRLQRLLLASY
ncbi:hypothetical protein FBU31_000424 [Coemansia sp. 'formosensis']|nr:hypothetical protein FBU31_000424 [Coemansia sp. 'formosensis']